MSTQSPPHRFVYRDNGVEAYCTICGREVSVTGSDSGLPDAVDAVAADESCERWPS